MKFIESLGTHFIGMFEAGARQFVSFSTGIIPLFIVLLTFTYSLVGFVGQERVDRAVRKCSQYKVLRYSVMPLVSILMLTNPMAFTMGKFVKEEEKPAFYDATVSGVHPVTGLFPYANAGELFIYLGIAKGVIDAGHNQSNLAVRYFLAGIVIMFIRGCITESITKYLIRKKEIS